MVTSVNCTREFGCDRSAFDARKSDSEVIDWQPRIQVINVRILKDSNFDRLEDNILWLGIMPLMFSLSQMVLSLLKKIIPSSLLSPSNTTEETLGFSDSPTMESWVSALMLMMEISWHLVSPFLFTWKIKEEFSELSLVSICSWQVNHPLPLAKSMWQSSEIRLKLRLLWGGLPFQ